MIDGRVDWIRGAVGVCGDIGGLVLVSLDVLDWERYYGGLRLLYQSRRTMLWSGDLLACAEML